MSGQPSRQPRDMDQAQAYVPPEVASPQRSDDDAGDEHDPKQDEAMSLDEAIDAVDESARGLNEAMDDATFFEAPDLDDVEATIDDAIEQVEQTSELVQQAADHEAAPAEQTSALDPRDFPPVDEHQAFDPGEFAPPSEIEGTEPGDAPAEAATEESDNAAEAQASADQPSVPMPRRQTDADDDSLLNTLNEMDSDDMFQSPDELDEQATADQALDEAEAAQIEAVVDEVLDEAAASDDDEVLDEAGATHDDEVTHGIVVSTPEETPALRARKPRAEEAESVNLAALDQSIAADMPDSLGERALDDELQALMPTSSRPEPSESSDASEDMPAPDASDEADEDIDVFEPVGQVVTSTNADHEPSADEGPRSGAGRQPPLVETGLRAWAVVEPAVLAMLAMINAPLRFVPESWRVLVDVIALTLVFWVPVAWVVALFIL